MKTRRATRAVTIGGVALAAALVLACSKDDAPRVACEPTAGFACDNVVNAVALPLLKKEGVTPRAASTQEFCRRAYIDLTGAAPTWAEYRARCEGKSPAKIVDLLMSEGPYVDAGRRVWADAFQLDNRFAWYAYTRDLDAQVARLYKGEIDYAELARVAVSHPAMISKHAGENVVAKAYAVFLGRDALPSERQDMLGLFHIWATRESYDPALFPLRFNRCSDDSSVCDKGRVCRKGVCEDPFTYIEVYVDPSRCAGELGAVACSSPASGVRATLPPGRGDAPLTLGELTPEDLKALRAPGDVIVKMPSFWEHAVDAVLERYLGWWHAGIELPGYDLPEVRRVLAERFKKTGAMRSLERDVLTSVLYGMAADGSGKPHQQGPTKQMPAEAWLATVGKILAVRLGSCDPRYQNTTGRWVPEGLLAPPGDLQGFAYVDHARILGGCPDQSSQLRSTSVGVLHAMEERLVLADVCMHPRSAARTDLAALFRDAFTREPSQDELAALKTTFPQPDEPSARRACQVLLRSSPFLFY
ncbi:MAG: hypothetical protein JWM74_4260 [Myxococcaceae bacterium]|nr:hypothetical protein [Myxococcaceae bacterium]